MGVPSGALTVLEKTSRTFYIPISRLPADLKEAVVSAYLCMRAIDEIEDHPTLDRQLKARLLRQLSLNFQSGTADSTSADFAVGLGIENELPEVTLRVGEWAMLAPRSISPRVWDATAAMADRMAYWSDVNWTIDTKADLDRYTFSVAGAVGLLLSDLWAWYDGTSTDRLQAIGFGRGLQSVNILRNYRDDLERGVNFFPDGWGPQQMQEYARYNLSLADAYTEALPKGPVLDFCRLPLMLAHGTLDAIAAGKEKLSRQAVMSMVQQLIGSR